LKNLYLIFKKKILNIIYLIVKNKKKIIKFESHNNQIRVTFNENDNSYNKLSNGKFGNESLLREYEGIKWYFDRQNLNHDFNLKKDRDFYTLKIKKIDGYKKNYLESIIFNSYYLDLCINHYFKIWPNTKFAPYHGDLTLDNIFFENKKDIKILDWECFTKKGVLFGADISYLLISSIFYPNFKKNNIDQNEFNNISFLWKKFLSFNLDEKLTKNPIDYFLDLYQTNSTLKHITNVSPSKFFALLIGEKNKKEIHDFLNKF